MLAAATTDAAASGDRPRLALGAGHYDFNRRDDEAIDLRLEYRWGRTLGILKPWAGLELTGDEAIYGITGVLVDIEAGERWIISPGLGVGAYRDGDGKDLGHTLEFRSQIELSCRLAGDASLGVAFSHISNADLGDRNPGTEILTVYYSIPLD